LAGLLEVEGGRLYNCYVAVTPQGFVAKHRKVHEFSRSSTDRELFPVFDLGFARVGVSICYDNMFPELARTLALRGADILLMPHAARLKMWEDTAESEAAARR
jgi:predicted amidohydrolase